MSLIEPGQTRLITLAVDFNESPSLGIDLNINGQHKTKLVAPLGDILYPVKFLNVETFTKEQSKLTGMNEVITKFKAEKRKFASIQELRSCLNEIVLQLANVYTNQHFPIDSKLPKFFYSACTAKYQSLILITIEILIPEEYENQAERLIENSQYILEIKVNCEKMVLGSMMSKMIKDECLKRL